MLSVKFKKSRCPHMNSKNGCVALPYLEVYTHINSRCPLDTPYRFIVVLLHGLAETSDSDCDQDMLINMSKRLLKQCRVLSASRLTTCVMSHYGML